MSVTTIARSNAAASAGGGSLFVAKKKVCVCGEWRSSAAFCPDLSVCRYVTTRMRIRELQALTTRTFVVPNPNPNQLKPASAAAAPATATGSSAPGLELSIRQRPDRLHSGDADSTGAVIWGCGVLLVRWLAAIASANELAAASSASTGTGGPGPGAGSALFAGRTVLELGSGTGVVSIALSALTQPARIVLTDAIPENLLLCRVNAHTNRAVLGSTAFQIGHYFWGTETRALGLIPKVDISIEPPATLPPAAPALPAAAIAPVKPVATSDPSPSAPAAIAPAAVPASVSAAPFACDVVVCSDVIYFSDSHTALFDTLNSLTAAASSPVVLLSVKRRDSDAEAQFLTQLSTHFALYRIANLQRCGCRLTPQQTSTPVCTPEQQQQHSVPASSAAAAADTKSSSSASGVDGSASKPAASALHVCELDGHDPNLELYVLWKRPPPPVAGASAGAAAAGPVSDDTTSGDRAFISSHWLLHRIDRITPLTAQLTKPQSFDFFL